MVTGRGREGKGGDGRGAGAKEAVTEVTLTLIKKLPTRCTDRPTDRSSQILRHPDFLGNRNFPGTLECRGNPELPRNNDFYGNPDSPRNQDLPGNPAFPRKSRFPGKSGPCPKFPPNLYMRAQTGRKIQHFSATTTESEMLLSPNFHGVARRALQRREGLSGGRQAGAQGLEQNWDQPKESQRFPRKC